MAWEKGGALMDVLVDQLLMYVSTTSANACMVVTEADKKASVYRLALS